MYFGDILMMPLKKCLHLPKKTAVKVVCFAYCSATPVALVPQLFHCVGCVEGVCVSCGVEYEMLRGGVYYVRR
jgi:hypothetical protein